ncbi:MAG TPA: SAM-dependent methyltransferase [Thermoanaerobaculia bacterium]|nr:SAM-dependent methyltransferase [Thermoanaerobaculia bacterium]
MPVGPSRTAEMVCFARAGEAMRPASRRIVDDPYARFFLRPMVQSMLGGRSNRRSPLPIAGTPAELTTFVLCRHRAIDDRLVSALDDGVEQVVILGAGYDTRAWRFAEKLGGRPVWEVDFPATARRKESLARRHAAELPATTLHRVEVDFERDSFTERLTAEGFVSGARTFFVWEGVSMYLTRRAVKESLDAMRDLGGAGSELAADFWYMVDAVDPVSFLRRLQPNLLALLGEPVLFGIHPEDVGDFLARQKIAAREVLVASDLEARYLAGDSRRCYPAFYVVAAGW